MVENEKLELKKLLNQKTNYSTNNLENKLNLFSSDLLINIINLLKDTINDFNYENLISNNNIIKKSLYYIDDILINENTISEDLIHNIDSLKQIIIDKTNRMIYNKNYDENIKYLNELNIKLSYFLNIINYKKNKKINENLNEEVIALCSILTEKINKFNFDIPVYYNKSLLEYVNKINEFINSNLSKVNKDYLKNRLLKLKSLINKKIKDNELTSTIVISNKAFLLSLNSEINYCIIKINPDRSNVIEDNLSDVYDILNELIFKIKNPIYLEEILNNYSNLILIKKNNRFLFEEVWDKYINILLNRNDDFELLYFNKLVLTFINNSKLDEEFKIIVMSKIDKLLNSLENRNLSIEKCEKVKFFLEEINNIYTNPKKNNLENLKIKYNLKRITELEKFKIIRPNWKQYKENNKYILTFDNPNAKILENAISLDKLGNGNYLLGIYIVDINGYLKDNIALKEYVYNNAMSIKGFPMIPKELLNKISLKEGKLRKVITCSFEFDSNLNLLNFKVERENIKVKHNLIFSDVKKIIDYPVDTKLKRKVKDLYIFSKYISKNKDDKKEYHDIKEISKRILYDNIYKEKNKGAKMVSDYQIYLNAFVSKYCYEHDLPYLYRNNEFNRSIELIDNLKNKYKNNLQLKDILDYVYAIYEPSSYSIINKGHKGLNLVAYGEISKPTRSLASIINQKLITDYFVDGIILDNLQKQKLLNELDKICNHINNKKILYDNYLYEENKIMKKR